MSTNADKVAAWREEHPSERLTAVLLWEIIGRSLHGADLHGANPHGANPRGANPRGANLRGADLCDAHIAYYGTNPLGVTPC